MVTTRAREPRVLLRRILPSRIRAFKADPVWADRRAGVGGMGVTGNGLDLASIQWA
jgi:hypothetical protein